MAYIQNKLHFKVCHVLFLAVLLDYHRVCKKEVTGGDITTINFCKVRIKFDSYVYEIQEIAKDIEI